MAGPKEIPSLPAKISSAKVAKSATATKPLLSTRLVQESDDSGDAKTAAVQKPKPKIARSKLDSANLVAPKPSTSQAKPSKKRKLRSPSPTTDESAGNGSGKDNNSQDEKTLSKKRILAAQNGNPTPTPEPATARLAIAKPPIKPSTDIKPLGQKKERGSGTTRHKSENETGGSSEESSSESERGSGSESESGSSDKTSLQSPRTKSPVQKSVLQQFTPTYEPPAGFQSTSISSHPASKNSEILAPSNLQGKQIWHITVPESVLISLVKEVSPQSIEKGASVLEFHGAKYGLVPGSDAEQASSQALLLPSTQTNSYGPTKTSIIKTLHLQQLLSFPGHGLAPVVHPDRSVSGSESYRKTPRQQPEGLRMRYRPFGASDGSDLEPTSEPTPKGPGFRTPAAIKEASPARKRKRIESKDGSSDLGSAVKSKKRKHSPQATAGAIEDPMDIDAMSDQRSDVVKSLSKSPHLGNSGVRSSGNLPNGSETKEERRKRREKKKLEQRESPSRLATALPLDVKQAAETMQSGEVVEAAPAVANAVEGTATINVIAPPQESKEDKAKRREDRRRRKEAKRASRDASLVSAENLSQRELADSQDQMMREIEHAQRDASIPVPAAEDGSPSKRSLDAHESRGSDLGSSRTSQRKETKEERAKRKEERRKRRLESRSA